MSLTDDDIRTALDAGVREADPIEPATLAAGLRTRSTRRKRRRAQVRAAVVGSVAVVALLVVGAAVRRDGSTTQVVADGDPTPSSTAPVAGPFTSPLLSSAYMMSPDLGRSMGGAGDDLVLVGRVLSVGERRAADLSAVPGADPEIPPPAYDYAPVEVDVEEYLHVRESIATPDPIRLRIIVSGSLAAETGGAGTVVPGSPSTLADLLPVGSRLLVFATRPVDTGDGLAATPSYLFAVTDDGVIDEHGDVVPMDDVMRSISAWARPPTSATAPTAAPATEADPDDWLAPSTPPPPLASDHPFRQATDAIAVSRGWTFREAWLMGSPDHPMPVVSYDLPDGRSVEFTHETVDGALDGLPLNDEQRSASYSVEGDVELIRFVGIEGVSGRAFVTTPDGTRLSAALVPPSVDGRTAYPPLGESFPTYAFTLDDLVAIVRTELIGAAR